MLAARLVAQGVSSQFCLFPRLTFSGGMLFSRRPADSLPPAPALLFSPLPHNRIATPVSSNCACRNFWSFVGVKVRFQSYSVLLFPLLVFVGFLCVSPWLFLLFVLLFPFASSRSCLVQFDRCFPAHSSLVRRRSAASHSLVLSSRSVCVAP